MNCYLLSRLLLVVLVTASLSACSKDDSGAPVATTGSAATANPPASAAPGASSSAASPVAAPKPASTGAATAAALADPKCNMRAARDCEKQCLAGDGPSCHLAAFLLKENRPEAGQKDDPKLRAKLEKRGCELGALDSCWGLGNQHEKGAGVPKDFEKALALWSDGCAKNFDYSCRSMGWSHFFFLPANNLGQRQDLEKASNFFTKACALGDKPSCELKANIAKGQVPVMATMTDLLVAPKKWVGKRVGIPDVGVLRISASSGTIYAPGSSAITDGISAIVSDDEDTRRKWLRVPGGVGKKTVVSYVEAVVEKFMAGDTRLRLVVVDLGEMK